MGFLDKFPLNKSLSAGDESENEAIVALERSYDLAQKLAIDAIIKTKFLPDQERKSILRKLKSIDQHNRQYRNELSREKLDYKLTSKELQGVANAMVLEDIREVFYGEARVPTEFAENREVILNQIKTSLETL